MNTSNSTNETLKRSSPSSPPVTKSKKLKTGFSVSYDPLKEKSQTPEVPKNLDPPTNGVVRITYCEAGPLPRDQRFRPWHLEKVTEITEQLARDGRRVIGHPFGIVMSDGITLCWVNDSTVRSVPSTPRVKEASDESHVFWDKGKSIEDPIMVLDIDDPDEGPNASASSGSRTRYTGSATPSLEYSSSNRPSEARSTSPQPFYTTSVRKASSQVPTGATYIELLPGQSSVGKLPSPQECSRNGTLSRRMSPMIIDASSDAEPDPNDLSWHHDLSLSARDNSESMDCDHSSPDIPEVSARPEHSGGISGHKPSRSRFSRMLNDDYSSDADSNETSSEDERLPALSKAVPTPLRELGPQAMRQDRHEGDNFVHSDSDDASLEESRTAHTASKQSSLPPRRPNSTGTTTRKRNTVISSRRGRDADDQPTIQVPPISSSLSAAVTINLPKAPHGRARRILTPRDENIPLVTISMRADVNYIDRSKPHYPRISLWSTPHSGSLCHVDDAINVNDNMVLGYSLGPCQASLVKFTEQGSPQNMNLNPQPHGRNNSNNQAVSSLTPIEDEQQQSRFASGGYDKRVYIWDCSRQWRNPVINDVKLVHNSFVSALAYRKVDRCLLSAAGSRVYETNLGHMRPAKDTRLSNNIHHIHVHPQDPNLIFMELNHLDFQVCIYDRRQSGFNRSPCVQFGYRPPAGKFNKPETRYTRGSVQYAHYVRGHKDGTVKLWDFRNIRSVSVVQEWSVGSEVVHTVFCGQKVAAIGGHVVHVLNARH